MAGGGTAYSMGSGVAGIGLGGQQPLPYPGYATALRHSATAPPKLCTVYSVQCTSQNKITVVIVINSSLAVPQASLSIQVQRK